MSVHTALGVARTIGAALLVGAAGFLTGYIAPIRLDPGAIQGPLMGIFVTGPAALLFGGLLGAISSHYNWRTTTFGLSVFCACIAAIALTFWLCLPADKWVGDLVDVTMLRCAPLEEFEETVIQHWVEINRINPQITPSAAWREDVRGALRDSTGYVAFVRVTRKSEVRERRRPWNRGTRYLANVPAPSNPEKYFIQGHLCSALDRRSTTFLARYSGSAGDPLITQDPATLLWLATLEKPPADLLETAVQP